MSDPSAITASPSTKPARKRGRPIGADADSQRRHILSCATDEFALRGPEATRIQHIATRAHVDRRLVYHYFQSKHHLYLEVLTDIFSRLTGSIDSLGHEAQTLEEFLSSAIQGYFAFCQANDTYIRMLMWENLREGRGLAQISVRDEAANKFLDRLGPLLGDAIAAGRCRADLDPVRLLLSCLSHCVYIPTNRYSLSGALRTDLNCPAFLEAWVDHAVNQVLVGIKPLPQPSCTSPQ